MIRMGIDLSHVVSDLAELCARVGGPGRDWPFAPQVVVVVVDTAADQGADRSDERLAGEMDRTESSDAPRGTEAFSP